MPAHPSIVDILEATLRRLESSEELPAGDPAVEELRASLVRTIAELQIARNKRTVLSWPGAVPDQSGSDDDGSGMSNAS